MSNNSKIQVLFICMGNICRSPTADGVFSSMIETQGLNHKVGTDSAATHAYHIGKPPDQRAQATAKNHGIDLSTLIARKVTSQDFSNFDYIIAMDNDNLINLKDIQRNAGLGTKASLHLFMEFAPSWKNDEVPDPYFGSGNGFEEVFKMVTDASEGLLQKIVRNL